MRGPWREWCTWNSFVDYELVYQGFHSSQPRSLKWALKIYMTKGKRCLRSKQQYWFICSLHSNSLCQYKTFRMCPNCDHMYNKAVGIILNLYMIITWLLHNLVEASFDLFRYLLLGDQLKPWELHPLVSYTICMNLNFMWCRISNYYMHAYLFKICPRNRLNHGAPCSYLLEANLYTIVPFINTSFVNVLMD